MASTASLPPCAAAYPLDSALSQPVFKDGTERCSEARGPAGSHAHPRAVPRDAEAIGSKAWLPEPTELAACVPRELCHPAHFPICKMG